MLSLCKLHFVTWTLFLCYLYVKGTFFLCHYKLKIIHFVVAIRKSNFFLCPQKSEIFHSGIAIRKCNFLTTLTYATREWAHYRDFDFDVSRLTCIHAVDGWIRVNGLMDAFLSNVVAYTLPSRARTSSSPLSTWESFTYWCGTCDHPDIPISDVVT